MIRIDKDTHILIRKKKDADVIELVFSDSDSDQVNVVFVPEEYSSRMLYLLLKSIVAGCKETNETIFLKEEDLHIHLPLRRREIAPFFIDYLKEKNEKIYEYALSFGDKQYWSKENIIVHDFSKKTLPVSSPKQSQLTICKFKFKTKLKDSFSFSASYTKVMGLRQPYMKSNQLLQSDFFEIVMYDAARLQLKDKEVIEELNEFIRTDKTLRLQMLF
ncbi:hypothetical protein [Bacillus cereus group sp. BY6-1LC]|uniref:hypothetical protein n=1 Tax=Bacillus cereus group sp. BY6-1LC TaxID=3018077 RepID=UPI0022E38E4F|nr:hypothetical protein [Bacillus cereus group sp. BY6-1LC]MDA1802872.1 hypothetical protein [Bacillus cereus group sp. BY6-1LC]